MSLNIKERGLCSQRPCISMHPFKLGSSDFPDLQNLLIAIDLNPETHHRLVREWEEQQEEGFQ